MLLIICMADLFLYSYEEFQLLFLTHIDIPIIISTFEFETKATSVYAKDLAVW